MNLIIGIVVDYMYKVQKNKLPITKFKEHFAAVRHGDYIEFLNLINKKIDFIVVYNNGTIDNNVSINEKDFDFIKLVKSGESLKYFYKECINEFGDIIDKDISDEIFEKLCLFELSLRMHYNNKRLSKSRITLENVINELKEIKDLSDSDIEILHKGRKFLNQVKRPEKLNQTWEKGTNDFLNAYQILESKKITII